MSILIWYIILIFFLAAALSAYAATRLSSHADTISRETKLGGVLAGTLLLAVATSLPELTVTISAGVIGNAGIAVGNGLGSILFNFFVLFILDLHFRNKRLFLDVSDHHIQTGIVALILCLTTAGALAIKSTWGFYNIGVFSIAIVFVYIFGMWFMSRKQQGPTKNKDNTIEEEPVKSKDSVKRAIRQFILFSVIILITGTALSLSGDALAQNTGISATAIGSILVALSSSIPDAMSVYVALKLTNVNMAIGTILGSNLFNILVIALADPFYTEGSIWQDSSDELMFMSFIGFSLTALTMIIIKRDKTKNTTTYVIPSVIAVVSYFVVVGMFIF
ncbi:sodium:calcium antiporter [Oceanobacillus manasiensis]|uniref:sodium:calcium antiporter n=1 Tax=Oceanobacillus manasiensis TaxID=586413 RepID=UPI0018DB69D0|nr:sodium:calcium antiporter [Oceanobacillus manasiensis]